MALTTTILVSLIVAANAGFVWQDDEPDFPSFKNFEMPNHHFPSIQMPRMPQPPRLPTLPNFPFSQFPFAGFKMPSIPLPRIPTAAELANVKPGPNQVFNAAVAKSSSGFTRDKDGKVVKTGGISFLVNDNGKIHEHKSGNNPPNLNDPIVFPTFHMPEFKPFEPIRPLPPIPPMKPLHFEPLHFEPIIMKDIEGYIPKEGEHFVGTKTSSYSHSENINGKERSEGGSSILVNNDGAVEKQVLNFGQHDKE